ncbi:phosphate ABC transporter, permease protein PstA [Nostoc sp. 'Peltigera membranacea cyanobiont' 213]|uniref:phosphate ABC transporter permease PstA n=1 Tax=Nostoc sp. 'Peltigera membranacea cyanobiont' 213 TaxID=2014530 RepID=UPI000B95A88E|nr:phosphate ABC transporter permease PstA [Nostoc sp. 'Peltigera membranacea cyanobiont' 213]OYD91814.1 phosphate ABC transporter, permease protein PstA [Nostoc sp. 'Peltigera membranacea cyanobiont' 213]
MSGYIQSETDESLARELCSPLPTERVMFTYMMNAIAFGFTGLALIPLLSILWEIFVRGISGLKSDMFVKAVIDNGFGNAILGTIIMVIIGAIFSIPTGIMTGIFLAEFGQTNPITSIVRFIASILTGVPSIVVGVFAYGVIVLLTKGFSAIAGGFALAVIMLPVIILTTEESLKLIPTSQRLASAALGGTRFQTTFRIVLTTAIPGITTGILLAVARAAGETAPLIFTALFSLDWSEGLLSPTASLPVLIFNLYNDPDPQKSQLVWTTSIVLIGLILGVSIISRLVIRQKRLK